MTKLPESWRWVKLGDVCEIIAGQSPPSSTYRKQPEGLPFFQGKADFGDKHPVPRMWCVSPKKVAQPGDILISVRAPVGPTNVADVECCIGRGLSAIRPNEQATRDFILFALKIYEKQLADRGSGSTFSAITQGDLRSLEIPFPPLDEQRRIVSILNKKMTAIDRARAAAESQLEAAQALPAAYLRQVFNSSEAEGWPRKRLGDIAATGSGTTPSRNRKDYYQNGKFAWIKTGELRDNVIIQGEEFVTDIALEETSLRLLPVDTLLIAMYGQGQTRGRTAILKVPATINQACFAVLPNPDIFDTSYLQFWFRDNYSRLREETENRGGNQPNLNGKILKRQIVPLPAFEKQKQIVSQLEAKIGTSSVIQELLQSQLNAINALPTAYLRQAFNGEL